MKKVLTLEKAKELLGRELKALLLINKELKIEDIRKAKRLTFRDGEEIIYVNYFYPRTSGYFVNDGVEETRRRELERLVVARKMLITNIKNIKELFTNYIYYEGARVFEWVDKDGGYYESNFYTLEASIFEGVEALRETRRASKGGDVLEAYENNTMELLKQIAPSSYSRKVSSNDVKWELQRLQRRYPRVWEKMAILVLARITRHEIEATKESFAKTLKEIKGGRK